MIPKEIWDKLEKLKQTLRNREKNGVKPKEYYDILEIMDDCKNKGIAPVGSGDYFSEG